MYNSSGRSVQFGAVRVFNSRGQCVQFDAAYAPGHLEAKKLAMLLAKLTKKEMTNLQKIVPGMSDYEAWTETMQEYCITPYPPELPKAEKGTEGMSAEL